jgi:hypothetical protein
MRIFLYSKPGLIPVDEIKEYLRERIKKGTIKARGDFSDHHLNKVEQLTKALASIRVIDIFKPFRYNEPSYAEIEYEKRVLKGEIVPHGVLYDGFRLQGILRGLLPRDERSLEDVHLVFTDRFFGTFDEEDLRYHGRVIVLGYPAIISTTGLVEAPAKPREFYIEKGLLSGDQLALEKLKQRYKGRFIDYGDPRMGEVMKGYAMQAIFYQVFKEAFCKDKGCRLYNAHWQSEVIEAQLSSPEFCKRHARMAKDL